MEVGGDRGAVVMDILPVAFRRVGRVLVLWEKRGVRERTGFAYHSCRSGRAAVSLRYVPRHHRPMDLEL